MPELADPVTLADALDTLPDPPTSWGYVGHWAGNQPEFDLEVWADEAAAVTGAQLLGGATEAAPDIADDEVESFDENADTATLTGHAYRHGDGPFRASVTGDAVLPAGLLAGHDYWLGVVDADTVQFYESLLDAMGAGDPVVLVDSGDPGDTGTFVLAAQDGAERVHWFSYGLIGPAGDGAIALDEQAAYVCRAVHRPRTMGYQLAAATDAPISASVRLVRPVGA